MTTRPNRPSEWLTLDDHQRRIRALEAVPPGEGGGTVFCVGCFDVDPDLADCVNLTPSSDIEVSAHTVVQGTFSYAAFTETEFDIGPYLCNYLAGFRLQVRYVGLYDGAQTEIAGGISHIFNTSPIGAQWTTLPHPDIGYFSPTAIDTGWVTITDDPTGTGSNEDSWYVWMGALNNSILFDATVGAGTLYFRYVNVIELSNYVPQPQAEGQILVAQNVGGNLEWVPLNPGTTGQVLTINGSGLPEWA